MLRVRVLLTGGRRKGTKLYWLVGCSAMCYGWQHHAKTFRGREPGPVQIPSCKTILRASIHPFFPVLPTGRGRRGGLPSLTLSGRIALRCDGEAQQRNQQGRCQVLNPWSLFSVGLSLSLILAWLLQTALHGRKLRSTEYGVLAARIEITSVIFSPHLEIPCFMWHCG